MAKNLLNALTRRPIAIAIAIAAAVAISSALTALAQITPLTPLTHVSSVPSRARRELVENSAAAMSARQPGVFFTINDSGNEPLLFAMDTTGAERGAWRVLGAANIDWESVSMGPCGSSQDAGRPQPGSRACVYIGDTGDNRSRYTSRQIYRVLEPNALPSGGVGTVHAERVGYVYEDGPHDVEAMYVAPNGDIFLITKRPIVDSRTQLVRPTLIFRLPANAWMLRGTVIAHLVDSVVALGGSGPLRQVTDASLSPDGRHLAVRTYKDLYLYATDPASGRIDHAALPVVCDVRSLAERQGEGVTWADNRGRFLFTSEGLASPLHLADCPPPRE